MFAGSMGRPLKPVSLGPTGIKSLLKPGTRCPADSNPMPAANFASLLMRERASGRFFPMASRAS
eukprot:16409005-Heterocapsa_arctica.AAC.1